MLFFKRISDVYDEAFEEALTRSDGDRDYAAFPENHRFQTPEGCHWRYVRERVVQTRYALESGDTGIGSEIDLNFSGSRGPFGPGSRKAPPQHGAG